MKTTINKCLLCNGATEYEVKYVLFAYKNHTKHIAQSGHYCKQCKEAFLSPKDLASNEKEIANFKQEVESSF